MPAYNGLFSQLKTNINFGTNEHNLLPYHVLFLVSFNPLISPLFFVAFSLIFRTCWQWWLMLVL
jgi:hypothetical protein